MPEIRITFSKDWDTDRRKKALADRADNLKGTKLISMKLERKGEKDVDYGSCNECLELADSLLIKFEH